MRAACVAALLVLGCGRDRTLHVELPPLQGARSAVFAVHTPQHFEARAVSLETGEVVVELPVDLAASTAGSLEAVAYESSLSELGLAAGMIESVEGGTRPLDPSDTMYTATFADGRSQAWTRLRKRSPELDAIRLAGGGACARFSAEASYALDSAEDHGFAIPIGPAEVLVAQEDLIALVDADGASTITDRPTQLPLTDGFALEDGTFVFGGPRGEVWSVRATTSTSGSPLRLEGERLTSLPSGTPIVRLVGGRETGALELFALDEPGTFWRYDGSRWTGLASFEVEVDKASGLVRLGPGVAYAGTDQKAQVLRYVDGRVEEHTPRDLANGVPGMGFVPGFGLVMALSEGGLYVLGEDDEWRLLGSSPIALNVYSITPYEDGLLFGGAFGHVAQYKRSIGYCEEQLLGAGFVKSIVPFKDGFLLGEDKPKSRDRAQVTIVRRVD